jgi:hypothetical protein
MTGAETRPNPSVSIALLTAPRDQYCLTTARGAVRHALLPLSC